MKLFLFYSLLAFLVGVLLNFTPCVLPIIPLKIQAVLREIKQDYYSRALAAIALLSGSLLFFLPLALATAYFSATWGSVFQSTWFLAALASILGLSAIATFSNWNFTAPASLQKPQTHRFVAAFFVGFLAAILATPCSGPFLGAVLAYTLTQPPVIIFVIYASIGVGLAFPYVLILLIPALLNRLQSIRPWSQHVNIVFGFILTAGALFFAQALLPDIIVPWLWYLLSAIIITWSTYRLIKTSGVSGRIIPALMAVMVSLFYLPIWQNHQLNWQTYSEQEIQRALNTQQPVLIEFTADWCLNCKILENTTYTNKEVVMAIKNKNIQTLRVDMTHFNTTNAALLKHYGGNALPFAVILNTNGDVAQQFKGMMSAQSLLSAIMSLNF